MKAELASLAANPLTYVIGFAIGGAASVVCGIAILAGHGWALVASGVFLICASGYITQGMKSNG